MKKSLTEGEALVILRSLMDEKNGQIERLQKRIVGLEKEVERWKSLTQSNHLHQAQ